MKTISFYTFGCRLNQAETAAIRNSFESNGYRVVDFDANSDIVVVNTCTVTENGDADTRRLVKKIGRLNPEAKIALVGCQAQVQREKLAEFSNVRWIVGNERKMDLVNVFKEYSESAKAHVVTPTIDRKPFTMPVAVDREHTRANLKIQDGCDFFCSFCEIPYARGRARSRVFDDIVLEAEALAAAGHKEIILTGINVGTYRYEEKNIIDVLDRLQKVEGLERIRISSIEPTTIPREIFRMMAGNTKLCRYLHIPLQSGHDDILTAMQRKYSVAEFSEFVESCAVEVPGICIGTDVIVGFPGETDLHFEETYKLLGRLPIHYFHVFSYSARHLAKSRDFVEAVSASEIQRRSQLLRDLSQRKRMLYFSSMLGTEQDVLFEENRNGEWKGLTDTYIRVTVKTNRGDLSNQICRVRLAAITGQTMSAILV